jgi:hypothetical protein
MSSRHRICPILNRICPVNQDNGHRKSRSDTKTVNLELDKLTTVRGPSLSQSNYKTHVIWNGRWGILCYNSTFSLLRASRSRALGPYAYSVKQQGRWWLLHALKKCVAKGNWTQDLGSDTMLEDHLSASPIIKSRWYGRGGGRLLCYSPIMTSKQDTIEHIEISGTTRYNIFTRNHT